MSIPPLQVPVALSHAPYTVHIGENLLMHAANLFPDTLRGRRVVVITQPEIYRLHGAAVMGSLTVHHPMTSVLMFGAGESHKTLATVETLYAGLYDSHPPVDRKTVIVALGGGVVGDVAGYVAATYLRGLAYVQIPTTLLAMVDSAVGGKTGVDFRAGKNLVGAFHQPACVVADVNVLETLPSREVRQALAEIVKYGIIADRNLLETAALYADADADTRRFLVAEMVRRCCIIKADVVTRDEREETGLRAMLNFGHTIGHALEAATKYTRYRHGEAVAIGMAAAAYIGVAAGITPLSVQEEIIQATWACDLPVGLPEDVADDTLLSLALRDKKAEAGAIRFVLAEDIGRVTEPVAVPVEIVRQGLRQMRHDLIASSLPAGDGGV